MSVASQKIDRIHRYIGEETQSAEERANRMTDVIFYDVADIPACPCRYPAIRCFQMIIGDTGVDVIE